MSRIPQMQAPGESSKRYHLMRIQIPYQQSVKSDTFPGSDEIENWKPEPAPPKSEELCRRKTSSTR
jgi:hypothetical protein